MGFMEKSMTWKMFICKLGHLVPFTNSLNSPQRLVDFREKFLPR
jgi:hypothetical protein